MGMAYDTPLLTGAQIVAQTGVQDLANLTADAELVLDTFALNAHRAIWRKLAARGIDPTALTNESLLKDAVAYEAIGRLAAVGYLGDKVDGQAMFALSAAACGTDFRPEYAASTDSPGRASDGIPAVGHLDRRVGEIDYSNTPSVT